MASIAVKRPLHHTRPLDPFADRWDLEAYSCGHRQISSALLRSQPQNSALSGKWLQQCMLWPSLKWKVRNLVRVSTDCFCTTSVQCTLLLQYYAVAQCNCPAMCCTPRAVECLALFSSSHLAAASINIQQQQMSFAAGWCCGC